jgi:3-oxoacyl-[acyl-carrier-protein] synthase II
LRRVVISGVGAVSPLGNDVASLVDGVAAGKSAVRYMEGWDQYVGLRSLVAAPAELRNEKAIPRKSRRSMGRMSILAVQATEQSLDDAGIEPDVLSSNRLGCVIGSTMGSAGSLCDTFETMLPERDLSRLTAMKFFQCVSHTAAMNVAQHLGITGCVMATSAACASSLQAIGLGYDLIRMGRQDVMICGGSEELHPTVTGSFDILFATSTGYNDDPGRTPRPFDADRDGLVCGEGSGILVLEERDRALERGATMYAEIVGYHTAGSGEHVSQSNRTSIVHCLREALVSAKLSPGDIDYISAHGTATRHGDEVEAKAIAEVFGDTVPVSSLKGNIGHTLGASGALELIVSLAVMKNGVIYPTLNLETVDEACRGIDHVREPLHRDVSVVMKNCFAFGGINAALVCRRAEY